MNRPVVVRISSVVFVALLAACSSGSGASPSSGPPVADDVAATSIPSARGTEVSLVESGPVVAREVTPERGGELSLELASGVVATLTVPPGALAVPRTLQLVALSDGDRPGAGPSRARWSATAVPSTTSTTSTTSAPASGAIGVSIEPAGLWLAQPARLTFSGSPGEVLSRVSMLGWYASAPVMPDGSIPVVRLRPFLFDPDGSRATDVPLDGSWDEVVLPFFTPEGPVVGHLGNDALPESGIEGLDQAARKEEADEAEGIIDGEERREQVAGEARRVVESLSGLCEDDPLAQRRVVEALRTNGASVAQAPKCVKFSVKVFASYTAEINTEGLSGLVVSEEVLGSADGVVQLEETTIEAPLVGVSSGWELFASLTFSGWTWLSAEAAGVAVPPPSLDVCKVSQLQGGALTIAVAPLPSEQLRVTVTPTKPGSYSATCPGESTELPSGIWDLIGQITGSTAGAPIVFTVPNGIQTTRILSQFTDRASRTTQIRDGVAVVDESGTRSTVTFSADVDFATPRA